METRYGDWMQTASGLQFWPLDPRPIEIRIQDIAHSLSLQCRYAGHCKTFYSVAQHSILVSQIVPRRDALWGLLHDATEAYLVDLPRPLKRYSELGAHYKAIEAKLMVVICDRFGLSAEEPESVRLADDIILITEMRDLMAVPPDIWREAKSTQPMHTEIVPITPWAAEHTFLERFHELAGDIDE